MKKFIYIMIFCTFSMTTIGQSIERQVIASYGGSFKNANLNLSYTSGDAIINSQKTTSFFVSEGFQQTGSISTGIGELDKPLSFRIEAFPNPTNGQLNIVINADESVDLSVELFDQLGRKHELGLSALSVHNELRKTIDISHLSAGQYTLRFSNSADEAGSLKILKY